MPKTVLLILLAASAAMAAPADEEAAKNPFDGWAQKQVAEHRRLAERRLRKNAMKQMLGLVGLTRTCNKCQGNGWVKFQTLGPRSRTELRKCSRCYGSGWYVFESKFNDAFVDFDRQRGRPEFLRARKGHLDAWRLDPEPARDLTIAGGSFKSAEVRGNHAVVETQRKRRRGSRKTVTQEWIFDGDQWCLASDQDARFKRWDYPPPDALPAIPTLPKAKRTGETVTIVKANSPIAILVAHDDGTTAVVELAGVIRPEAVSDLDETVQEVALIEALRYLNALEGSRLYLRIAKGLPSKSGERVVRLAYFVETGVLLQFEAVDRGILPALGKKKWEFDEHFARYEKRAREHKRGFWDFSDAPTKEGDK